MAMDVVVNTYLDYLPPYATTLERVNLNYSLKLPPFEPFEYYVEKIQAAVELLDVIEDEAADDDFPREKIETDYQPEKTHDIWEESDDIDELTLGEFTQKIVDASQKGAVPSYLKSMIASLKNSRAELPWNLYLRRLMGAVVSHPKKTTARKNRRQPDRLDLQGQLKSHKAKIVVALDISGSISDEEFYLAIKEVISIVKNYNHEITVVECDSEIRRTYEVKAVRDIKDRINIRGGTRFAPVFEYANAKKANLLVYFTDGKGEAKLSTVPKGYKILWVISGAGDKLSLKDAYGAVKKLSPNDRVESTMKLHDVVRDGYSMNNQEKSHI
jgi:predicted metal-dependent peptidase